MKALIGCNKGAMAMITWFAGVMPVVQERAYSWSWEMHPMWWMWGFGGVAMMLGMLVFWALIITAIVVGLRWFIGVGHNARGDSAIQILRERYARGEINREEFEARKRDLS